MSVQFFRQELGRNFRSSPFSHLGSLVISVLLFLLLDLLWVGSKVADDYVVSLFAELEMEVFTNDLISDDSLQLRVNEIQEIEGIERVQLITREHARQRLADRLGRDYLSEGEDNPLPRSIRLSFAKGFPTLANFDDLAKRFSGWRGIDRVSYARAWLETTELQLKKVNESLRIIMLSVLAGAMLNAALLSGLIVRSKTRDLYQMRLLGAGGIFLGLPHVVEGALMTGLSAALSWGGIILAQRHYQLERVADALPPYQDMIVMMLAVAFVGALGAGFAVRMALRKTS